MKVSVVMITYGHEQFIVQAINSILMQECNFPFELIVVNDHSPDNTDLIVSDFIRSHPKKQAIRYFNHDKNVGMVQNFIYALKMVKGEYIALCEGDDYWTDPFKLQRQLEFLEINRDYSMVAENGLVINTINSKNYHFNDIDECDIELYSLLEKRQFPTASVLFRASLLDVKFYDLEYAGDTILWCYLATKGKIKYLPNISSVYRRGLQGIVESTNKLAWAKLMERWNLQISDILPEEFDREILKIRNFDEYLLAFFTSVNEGRYMNSLKAIKKCFIYQPTRTFKTLSSILLNKFVRKQPTE